MLKFGFILLFVSSITCISNSTFDSLKKGILPFNNAGNNFFNLIRGDVDHSVIRLEEIQNLTLSFESLRKVTSAYLSHSILLAIGITFAVVLPIAGILFCLCRCCGKCGGKSKSMDPKYVRCKKTCYGIILTILVFGMMFAAIITLFNNQIVHESISNPDPSINIFLNVKSKSDNLKSILESMRTEITKSDPSQIDNQDLQPVTNELEGAIIAFFDNFMKIPDVLNLIEQSKSIKRDIDPSVISENRRYIENVNLQLQSLNSDLTNIKKNILQKLNQCNTPDCNDVQNRTNNTLQLNKIDENKINHIKGILDELINGDFKESLAKIIAMKDNGVVDLKLILDNEIKRFRERLPKGSVVRDRINERSFPNSVKDVLNNIINNSLAMNDKLSQYIPSPFTNESSKYDYFQAAKNVEQYRYNIYIGLSSVIILIIIFYFLGLLYGNCGERPEEDASCFNRGVGANFLMISITLTFLLSSLLMIVVLTHLMTTNVVQTDFCRYTAAPLNENVDSKRYMLIDKYFQLTLKLSENVHNFPDGMMEALFRNCEKENFYMAFSNVSNKYIMQSLKTQFDAIENNIVSNVANRLNLSKYLNSDPFTSMTTNDLDKLINSINLPMNDNALNTYLSDLAKMPYDMKTEISSLQSVIANVTGIRSHLRLVFQQLINIQNQFSNWKGLAVTLNERRVDFIKMYSSDILKSIQTKLVLVLDTLFGTMFSKVSCAKLRTNTMEMLNGICENVVDAINGCWYGLGFFLLLVIPALIFAVFLVSLYRRVQKFYPDKDEPDYENYIGFYARADGDAVKSLQNKPPHRGYKPIPLQ